MEKAMMVQWWELPMGLALIVLFSGVMLHLLVHRLKQVSEMYGGKH